MENFSQFIEQQREAGSVESAGSFTLAIEKARDKLGKHSLANPEDYILKVVQCAHRLEPDKISFTFGRDSVLVYFELDSSNHILSVDNLTRALLTPLEEKERARSHLALALCSLASMSPLELMWGDWDGEGTNLILSLGHGRSELFSNVPFPRTEPLRVGRRLHLLYIKKKVQTRLPISHTSKEQSVLKERCSFCPTPIEIDGKQLPAQTPLHASKSDPVKQLTSLYFGALKFVCEKPNPLHLRLKGAAANAKTARSTPPELKPVIPDHPPVQILHAPSHWPTPLQSNIRFKELYTLPSYVYGPSLIYFVQDGVMLHPLLVHDAGGGATAVLVGDEFATDVTGLQVVQSPECQRIVDRTVEVWKDLVDEFVDSNPPIYRPHPVSSGEDAVYFLFGCCLLAPFGHLVKGVLDYFTQAERKREILHKRFQRQLQTRRGYLSYFREG